MKDLSWVWLVCLVTTHFLAYLLGRGDGKERLDEQAELELRKYSYDKFYEHERWKAERADTHPMLQNPLTLEDLHALIDAGDEAVIYCETEDDENNLYGTILYGGRIYDRYGEAPGAKHVSFETYGKTWRAWATRPTDEERAAATWEE